MSPGETRRRVVITGVGMVSPLGDDVDRFVSALIDGRKAAGPIRGFETTGLRLREAGEMSSFDPSQYLGSRNLRPLDRTARLSCCAAHLALASSGWDEAMRARHEVGLVLGTMFGSVHTIAAFDRRALVDGPQYAKPMDFANTVINAAAGQTAILHDLRGLNSTVSGGLLSGLQAIGYAADAIRFGRADAVLAGGADELCYESFFGFHRAGLVAGSRNGVGPRPVPFDGARNGFVPSEGAALLMLEGEDTAASRGAVVHGEILGTGSAFAAGGFDQAATTLSAALEATFDDARAAASSFSAVGASANGSIELDAAEAEAFRQTLPEAVPVSAIKAALGESLGAGGAFAAVAMLAALERGVLPGVPGLSTPPPGLAIGAEPQPIDGRRGLVTGVGLDGNACAVALASGCPS